jgi:hypothetical protein
MKRCGLSGTGQGVLMLFRYIEITDISKPDQVKGVEVEFGVSPVGAS